MALKHLQFDGERFPFRRLDLVRRERGSLVRLFRQQHDCVRELGKFHVGGGDYVTAKRERYFGGREVFDFVVLLLPEELHCVCAGATLDRVLLSEAGLQQVVAIATVERVVAIATVERVVAVAAVECVVAIAPLDHVGASGARDGVPARRTKEVLDVRKRVAGCEPTSAFLRGFAEVDLDRPR